MLPQTCTRALAPPLPSTAARASTVTRSRPPALPSSSSSSASKASGLWWSPPHRRRCRCPPAAGLFGGLFGGGSQSQQSGLEEEEGLVTDEGGEMVALDASSSTSLDGSQEEPFGPLALLAVGFTQQEFERLRRLVHEDMEGGMVQLIPASAAAMAGSLGAALEQDPAPPFEQAPLGTRRVLFFSGMYAAEVMETIAAVRESGLPEAVFAAAVPNNYDRPVQELVQEVFADHQAMKAQRQRQQQQRQQEQQQRQ